MDKELIYSEANRKCQGQELPLGFLANKAREKIVLTKVAAKVKSFVFNAIYLLQRVLKFRQPGLGR